MAKRKHEQAWDNHMLDAARYMIPRFRYEMIDVTQWGDPYPVYISGG